MTNRFKMDSKTIGLERHSYVSLFGRNSLDDVRTAIAENTKDTSDFNVKPDMDSIKLVLTRLSPVGSILSKIAGYIPGASNQVAHINRFLFLAIRNQIVCIDDLERAGAGLEMKTVLGLALNLKDERDCKVIILLNQGALKGDKEKEFSEQLEKVADTIISFEPTAAEAAGLALPGNTELDEWLSTNVQKLGIVNIRVIRKAERACKHVLGILDGADKRLRKQVVHTIALATFAKFQPEEAPPINFIKSFNSMADFMGAQRSKTTDPDAQYKAKLRHYEFTNADDFDLLLIQGVERGTFDSDVIKTHVKGLAQKLAQQDKNQSYQKGWDLFHRSFDDNQDQVLDDIYNGLVSNITVVDATNLSATISFLKEMGRGEQAKQALHLFMDSREEPLRFWDLSRHPFSEKITDPDLRAAFAKKITEVNIHPNPTDILISIIDRSGWDPDEVAFLATLSAADYVRIFKSLRGEALSKAVRGGLYFRDVGNADQNMKQISVAVQDALQIIGAESLVNEKRIRRYGVELALTPRSGTDMDSEEAVTPGP